MGRGMGKEKGEKWKNNNGGSQKEGQWPQWEIYGKWKPWSCPDCPEPLVQEGDLLTAVCQHFQGVSFGL